MTDSAVRRQIFETLNQKGTIANGNVVRMLMSKANVSGPKGEKAVRDVIAEIQGSGQATVVRDGETITRVTLKNNDRRRTTEKMDRCSRNDYPAAVKSEMIWAKGVSSHLSDEQCSPVVVTTKAEQEKAMATPNNMPAKITPPSIADEAKAAPVPTVRDLLEWVNLGLAGLQCLADPDTGKLPIGSVIDYLMTELARYGITQSRATQINQLLAKLGLRSTVNLGFPPKVDDKPRRPLFQSTVVTTVTEVTQAMLDVALSSSKSIADTFNEVDESESPDVEVEAPVVESEVALPSAKLAEMSKVLKYLDEQIEILGTAGREKDAEISRLQQDLETVQRHNRELQSELAELRATPIDPETASILEKYGDI